MPAKVHGTSSKAAPAKGGAAKNTRGPGLKGEATPILMVIAGVILVLILGAGGFYAFNGGWKTASQQDEDYKHNLMPIMAAKHGDTEALEAENKLRKEKGQPPLELHQDRRKMSDNNREKLAELQKKLGAQPGK